MPRSRFIPTIEDVAKRARVGVSTVSKVLNGYKGIASDTRKRVEDAVRDLEYQPNRAARSFRTGRTHTASVFVPRFGVEFYDRLITALDAFLAEHDYDAALFPLLSNQRLQRYRSPSALPYQADGVILASLNPDWLFPNAKLPVPLPAILVDAYHAAYDTITVDNAGGAIQATRALLKVQAPTFMMQVAGYDDSVFASGVFIERLKGFRAAMKEAGRSVTEETVRLVPFDTEAARKETHVLLGTYSLPINIFASCDALALGALEAARDRNLTPGRGVRLVGFDDLSWAEAQGLTTVRQPIEEMGRLAGEMLLERFRHRSREPRHVELKPELISRTTT